MNVFSVRRDKLCKDIGNNSIAIFYSGDSLYDPENGFKVNRNFYYLTGLNEDSMILLLMNNNNKTNEIIFTIPNDKTQSKWVGDRMKPQLIKEISGVSTIRNFYEFDSLVEDLFEQNRLLSQINVFLDLWKNKKGTTLAEQLSKKIKNKNPNINIFDIFPYITNLRLVKDDYEISYIKQAIEITGQGINTMMKSIKPNINEMYMEGLFNYVLSQNLCNETAFKTICASGSRATVLHYSNNNQSIKEGELFLQDLGATYNHYCADITRTYPVNGVFTDRQKELYQIVLNAQQLVKENALVGIKLKELNQIVINYYSEELPKHGLVKPVREYYYHSVSHHLGLDCHDIDGGLGSTLEAGNVITNEPGLYVQDEGIGIRIEDDLLITATGAIELSKNIIKEIDDIEKFMNS